MVFYRQLTFLWLFSLSGCSATGSSTWETLRYAFLGSADVDVTTEQVNKIPYASAYLQVGDNPQAFVVLAFADPDSSLTWIGADNNIFVTKYGRIIKTVGLDNDLYRIDEAGCDPLRLVKLSVTNKENKQVYLPWLYRGEWSKDYLSGYQVRANVNSPQSDTLIILGKSYQTWRFDELIEIPSLNQHWFNKYWIDLHNGELLRTEQQLGPKMPVIKMTILKPYLS
ncbi:YjbF family lipoprotein [Aeromonas salmonicida]|uniref:YjbF family lipoprotein n=1 Tax=Aeromonas salmonicida TaxID=645 RepID=UPI003D25078C